VIVVDTSVLAYLLLPCEFSSRADALYKKDSEWAAPIFWRSEFRNLLARYLRRKTLTFEQAVQVQAEAEAILSGNEYEVDSRHFLELVRGSDCTAYDCEFVALAIKLGVKATTVDKKLLKAFPDYTARLPAANVVAERRA
jgi:predicted nucleic acid-binding protein